MFKLSMLLIVSIFSFSGISQSSTEFDGKYVGKFSSGGFEDSLIISNGQIAHIRNSAWSYGTEHQFVYNMISLKGEMIKLEQVQYFRDRVEFTPDAKLAQLGEMHERTFVLMKDTDGNLQMVIPGGSDYVAIFKKVE